MAADQSTSTRTHVLQKSPDYNSFSGYISKEESVSLSDDNSCSTHSPIRGGGLRELHLHRLPDFQGYGFHLQYNKAYYLIYSIEPNSPAERGGLKDNDVVLMIDNQSTDRMNHSTFVKIINQSSEVTLVVQDRDGYLCASPSPPRAQSGPSKPFVASGSIFRDRNDKKARKWLSKVLNKLTSR